MKHLKILLFAVLTLFAASACSQNNPQKTMEKKKVLVVFFSATGTTKQVAVNLAKIVDADICEIIPLQPYTSADLDWHNSHSRSSVEMNNSESRPDIKPIELDLKNYDCIFLGYAIWWDLAPRVVNTFIESNDLTGKTVIPFATSGGSSIEMNNPKDRPEIKAPSVDVSKYDCVLLGYPIWWDLAPRVVNTFIERNNLTGKTVIPFATSGSSTITTSVAALKKSYPKIKWQTGKLLNHISEKEIGTWVSASIK